MPHVVDSALRRAKRPLRCVRGRFGRRSAVCSRWDTARLCFGCRPGCEEVEGVADLVVVEGLGPRAVVADVVGAPAPTEGLAAGGELADEIVQVLVVGIV